MQKLTYTHIRWFVESLDPFDESYEQQVAAIGYLAKLIKDDDAWSACHAYQIVDGWSRRHFADNIRQVAKRIVG
jgi:hypothetical protein